MKKINIDQTSFENIVSNMFQTYSNSDRRNVLGALSEALEKNIFNVKESYKPDEWNVCSATPPEEYDGDDVIIRRRYLNCIDEYTHHTKSCDIYVIGYYNASSNAFFLIKITI